MTIKKATVILAIAGAVAAGIWLAVDRKPVSPDQPRSAGTDKSDNKKIRRPKRPKTHTAQVIARSESDPVYKVVLSMLEKDLTLEDEKGFTDELRRVLAQLSEDELKLVRMNLHMNSGDKKQALKVARDLMDSDRADIRRLVAQAFGWIGAPALTELTQMLKDPDPSVVQEALEKWQTAFDQISTEDLSPTMLMDLLPVLESRELIHCALMTTTRMSLRNGLETVSGVIEENAGNALLQEVAREMWTHLTGGEQYANANSVQEHMDKREREEKEGIKFWRQVNAAREAGDMERLSELLGYDVEKGRKASWGTASGTGTGSGANTVTQ